MDRQIVTDKWPKATGTAASFVHVHGVLLALFTGARSLPRQDALSHVRTRMLELRGIVADWECVATRVSYERYLSYFAKCFGDADMVSELTLLDQAVFKAELARDPGRFEHWMGLALCHLARGEHDEARIILQRVAASNYPEAELARKQLAAIINEALA